MIISWHGFNYFKLKDNDHSLVLNPYALDKDSKFSLVNADVILFSDPSQVSKTKFNKEAFVIDSPGEYEVKGVAITGISSESTNIIYHLFLDKLNIVHLGDLGEDKLTEEQLEEIGQTDILLMPKSAAEIVAQLEPKIIIPMCEAPEQFLKEIGVAGVEAQPKLSISKEKLPEEPIVVVLKQS